MKVISIVGARPQFIKLAPFSKEVRKFFSEVIVHTGQHFDKKMSDSFFNELNIPNPDYNLNVKGGLHGEQSGRMMIELEKVVMKEEPDLVVIFGDTNSTLAGALVAAKLNIPSLHIEAGLRSFNKSMPEEVNRIVADHISDYLFAPTETAYNNLKLESLENKTYLTGDIMVDAHMNALERTENKELSNVLKIKENEYYLLTLHRPYNVDDPLVLSGILKELGNLDKPVLFPVHPRTKGVININKILIPENVLLTDPVSYLDFVNLQLKSLKIITDSGGIQKEAYILKKPCITLRSETEWVETVNQGWNLLINPSEEVGYFSKIDSFVPPKEHKSIFGTDVAHKMIELIRGFI